MFEIYIDEHKNNGSRSEGEHPRWIQFGDFVRKWRMRRKMK
jgi:hypothetical protein